MWALALPQSDEGPLPREGVARRTARPAMSQERLPTGWPSAASLSWVGDSQHHARLKVIPHTVEL